MKVLLLSSEIPPADPALLAAADGATVVPVPDDDTARAEGAEADACLGTSHLRAVLDVAQRLRWVQAGSAGTEHVQGLLADHPEVTLTSAAGVYDVPITEHTFGLLLALNRYLDRAAVNQREHAWRRPERPCRELAGATLGIVGLGSIGRRVAQTAARGFDMTVLGHKRRPVDAVEHVAEIFYGADGLRAMLARCDVVVVAAALSDESRHLVDAAALDALPRHAVLINIARGAVVDQAALIERLRDGRLAAAGLDVTDPEPLPPDNPLWDLPNVLISPHLGGWSERGTERRRALYLEQLGRFVRGEPLRNVVDRQAGY